MNIALRSEDWQFHMNDQREAQSGIDGGFCRFFLSTQL
jgi:hypothetical protein